MFLDERLNQLHSMSFVTGSMQIYSKFLGNFTK
jgi:hypothetical protein